MLIFQVVREAAPGCWQLAGNNGQHAWATRETKVAGGAALQPGQRLTARTGPGSVEGRPATVALEVAPLVPDPRQLASLVRLLERFVAAGLGDLGIPDPGRFLVEDVYRLPLHVLGEWRPERAVRARLEERVMRFPMTWWHDDPEPGVLEMQEILDGMGCGAGFPAAALTELGWARLGEAGDGDDEDRARIELCRALADAANQALAAAGDGRRFFAFQPVDGEEEPFWLLLDPALRDGLLREKLFAAWGA